MLSPFERMVAFRYLRARREEGLISVIALFSLIGIALGVATLIVVLAVMNGVRGELIKSIIGLEGHVAPPMADQDCGVGGLAQAALGGGQGFKAGDDAGQGADAGVGGEQAQKFLGGGVELGLVGDGGEADALGLGREGRGGDQGAQVGGVLQRGLDRLEVFLDGRKAALVLREVKQGARVTLAHFGRFGIVRHSISSALFAFVQPRMGSRA